MGTLSRAGSLGQRDASQGWKRGNAVTRIAFAVYKAKVAPGESAGGK